MNWYKYAETPISISLNAYEQSIDNILGKTVEYSQQRTEELKNYNLNLEELKNVLVNSQYPKSQELISAIQTDQDLSPFFMDIVNYKKNLKYDDPRYQYLKQLYKFLIDYADFKDKYYLFSEEDAKNLKNTLIRQTYKNMENIAELIKNRINAINWNGSTITIQAIPHDKENMMEPQTDAWVTVGPSDATFTLFIDDNIIVDDILDAEETDFFPNNQVKMDYFNLVKEIQSPGSHQSKGKILTLYTARPIKDREFYQNTNEIPSNIYLTNNYSRVQGIASDLAGSDKMRDIWKVRIRDKYLIPTLETPSEKDYQTIGETSVPVESMTLLDPGE